VTKKARKKYCENILQKTCKTESKSYVCCIELGLSYLFHLGISSVKSDLMISSCHRCGGVGSDPLVARPVPAREARSTAWITRTVGVLGTGGEE
jgi:hypothetical protein